MAWNEILGIIGSICSIISLFIALFIASSVIKIINIQGGSSNIKGNENTVIGRDGYVGKEQD